MEKWIQVVYSNREKRELVPLRAIRAVTWGEIAENEYALFLDLGDRRIVLKQFTEKVKKEIIENFIAFLRDPDLAIYPFFEDLKKEEETK